ncbi:MAG: GDSL-type esterase/lipase family protein [Scytonema sp. PMC 1069.18]|nr:GDSL-type esterase/lipase family protein [Scytonema sp. PMC 1069.18]MEC4881393.1 GDSL-type esterase/lipase family protein [Scytonema sp. PMC 1070.18]
MQTLKALSSMPVSAAPKHCQPLKIVALGDSLIYGFGDPEGGGWVERLRRCWMSPDSAGHVLYNLGVRGDRVQQVSHRLEVEFRHRGELRNQVPDLIILSVGVNDTARLGRPNGRNYTDFATFESQIASLLDRAQQLCPVLFVGMVPVNEAKMPFLDCLYYNHADQYRYKEATRIACLHRRIPYLDIFQQWMEHDEAWRLKRVGEDGLHPNTLGYQTLLKDVMNWEAMADYNSTNWRREGSFLVGMRG